MSKCDCDCDNDSDSVYESVVIPDLTEMGRKLKNNIVAFSVVSIFMFYGEVSVSEDSSFLGFSFNGLTQEKIYFVFAVVILYSSLHYAFLIRDFLYEWRLRCSTVRIGNDVNPEGDMNYLISANNSNYNNLYYWWQCHKKHYIELMVSSDKAISSINERIHNLNLEHNGISPRDLSLLHEIQTDFNHVNNYIKSSQSLQKGNPIEESLKRFDGCFKSFLRFQNFRWLVFEYLMPYLLASFSLYCLSRELSPYLFAHL